MAIVTRTPFLTPAAALWWLGGKAILGNLRAIPAFPPPRRVRRLDVTKVGQNKFPKWTNLPNARQLAPHTQLLCVECSAAFASFAPREEKKRNKAERS